MYVSRIAQLLRAGLRRKVPHISRTGGKGMQMTGHAGFDKPQDCSVTVTLRDAGGVEILLQSKQEKMFGSAIRSCAAGCLEELGVENALVEIQDYGCLDFAIRARLKTAVRRARGAEHG